MAGRLAPDSAQRRLALALAIWAACTAVYFASAPRQRLTEHTSFNHYALLADGWLHGRLDLGHPPPAYAQNNDFAQYQGKWFISFPPFPALLLAPLVKLAGSPENLRDGQVWLWVAGVAPALLFLVLEKLRRTGRSERDEATNAVLALTFAVGTVYFFTAEQGTVWFAGHVVGASLAAGYLLAALDADRPVVAGLLIGALYATRPPMAMLALFFGLEAARRSLRPAPGAPDVPDDLGGWVRRLDLGALARRLVAFALPIALVVAAMFWHNHARFGRVGEYGHNYLTVGWHARIEKWGLFSYHYLARNLGVMLTSLPYVERAPLRVQINTHGLALWLTTPVYLWLLWPRRKGFAFVALAVTAALVAGADLLYQNSGWRQFGYRFSNDYAVLLFCVLAVGGYRFGKAFWGAALVGVAINAFGALTFDRAERFYFEDASQRTLYQPD